MSTPISTAKLIRVFIKMRNTRSALKKKYEDEDAVLKANLRLVENELLSRAQAENVEGYRSKAGTTYRGIEQHVSIADRDLYHQFVMQTGDLEFFEQRPSLGHIVEYQKNHDGRPPPGIRLFREERMRVRASNKGKGDTDGA
jgi:hypothetical protein